MTGIIDFSLVKQNRQDIADDLAKRVDVIKAGLNNIEALPDDLYDLPFALLPSKEEKLARLESKYEELVYNHSSVYYEFLVDLNSLLVLHNKLQREVFSIHAEGFDPSVAPITDYDKDKLKFLCLLADEIKKIDDMQNGVSNIIANVLLVMSECDIEPTKEDSDITKFCIENEKSLSLGMDVNIFDLLQTEIIGKLCESLNMAADLDMENLDIELGYLYHNDNIDYKSQERKHEIIKGIANRSNYFLSVSEEYLNAVQRHCDAELLVDVNNDIHAPH